VKEECKEIFQDEKGFSNDFRVAASVKMFMRWNSSFKLAYHSMFLKIFL